MARTRILRKKMIEILEREGDMTGGDMKYHLDNELRWGGGSINAVVMLLRRNGQVEKKGMQIYNNKAKRHRQIIWGLKE
jgi:hypothetical protein